MVAELLGIRSSGDVSSYNFTSSTCVLALHTESSRHATHRITRRTIHSSPLYILSQATSPSAHSGTNMDVVAHDTSIGSRAMLGEGGRDTIDQDAYSRGHSLEHEGNFYNGREYYRTNFGEAIINFVRIYLCSIHADSCTTG